MQIFKNVLNKIRRSDNETIGVGVNTQTFEAMVTSLIIVLVAFGGFGLGRLSKNSDITESLTVSEMTAAAASEKTNIEFGAAKTENKDTGGEIVPSTVPGGFIVASKSGKKYHFPWCSGAQQIKEENKVWFTTEEEARAAGYTPAANCKGLAQ